MSVCEDRFIPEWCVCLLGPILNRCMYVYIRVSHFISDSFCFLCFVHMRERCLIDTKIDVLLLCVVDHSILGDRFPWDLNMINNKKLKKKNYKRDGNCSRRENSAGKKAPGPSPISSNPSWIGYDTIKLTRSLVHVNWLISKLLASCCNRFLKIFLYSDLPPQTFFFSVICYRNSRCQPTNKCLGYFKVNWRILMSLWVNICPTLFYWSRCMEQQNLSNV